MCLYGCRYLCFHSHEREQGGIQVGKRHGQVTLLRMQLVLPAANHGDAHGFFVEHVLAFYSVSAHADAVVGGEDDEGIVVHTAVFQGLDDASHMFVHSGDAGVVVADVFAEVVAFRSALFRNVGQLSGQCFHIERVVQPFVGFGHQFVARMWGIHKQLRLLALGAPILVYNDEYTDTIGHQEYVDSLKEQIRSWWEVTDRESAFEIVDWLLREGHHAEADRVLAAMRNGQETEGIDEDKVEDVSLITDYMLENSICDMNSVPHTAIAWDLVRIVNLGRWAFQCGYITEEDMWNIMCVADETASANFSSWEEYGMSFVLGRGVWHGDTDDCQTAYEIVAELLKNEDSPWLQLSWSD